MTASEILAAIKVLPIDDLQIVRQALPQIIYDRYREARQAECPHTETREERRGDRSIDTFCRKCGALVEWR